MRKAQQVVSISCIGKCCRPQVDLCCPWHPAICIYCNQPDLKQLQRHLQCRLSCAEDLLALPCPSAPLPHQWHLRRRPVPHRGVPSARGRWSNFAQRVFSPRLYEEPFWGRDVGNRINGMRSGDTWMYRLGSSNERCFCSSGCFHFLRLRSGFFFFFDI